MRKRIEERIRKGIRRTRRKTPGFISQLQKHEGSGIPLEWALRRMMLDPEAGWPIRGDAAKLLAIADSSGVSATLLDLFFAQMDKIMLWETALTIESGCDRSAVPRLIRALSDPNPDRRHTAARALGWIQDAGPRAAKALIRALLDHSQPQPVREEAAESLAYSHYEPAIAPLISVLEEPDVRIRFWAVFALGGLRQWQTWKPNPRASADPRVIVALENMLADEEVAPCNWWSVGREALAMLGKLTPSHGAKLDAETQRVLSDPNSSSEDRRWAESYSRSMREG